MRKILTALFFGLTFVVAQAANPQRHVVLVVWDGMRPDFINSTNSPTLFELANRGVFFAHNHPVYISSTEVNGTALATGAYPGHSGIIGNREFRPGIDPLAAIDTQSLEAMRQAEHNGKYLEVPTLAETLQAQGYSTVVAGTKPVVLLHDHAERSETATNTVLFEGHSLPATIARGITDALGPFNDKGGAKTNRDIWTARALTETLWKNGVPSFSVMWMAEPDNTQHATGIGSAESLRAIRNSDHALSLVIAALKEKGVYDSTDIFVVSDHGFSTISGGVNIVEKLRDAGFHVERKFEKPPKKGHVMLVGLGGSVLLYVTGHEKKTINSIVECLQAEESVGPIFTARGRKGTFALDEARIDSSNAPDIVFSFRWTTNRNAYGAPGTVIAESQNSNGPSASQRGTHASLSPFDMHNTLVAAGPDFRQGFVDEIPSGNVDVAPTIIKILGAKPPGTMDGRVLSEALASAQPKSPSIRKQQLRAHTKLPAGEWTQTLDVSEVNGVRYLDQGTAQFTPKAK
jgi:arylsulfatase A-like enzyme